MQLLFQPNVSARFISGIIWDKSSLLNNLPLFPDCGTYFSICSIKGWPFIIEKDSFAFSTLPARFQHQILHFYGKLQSFWLMKSKDVQNNPGDPQLWRTGGVPPVLSLLNTEKGARPENTRGKITISLQKGQKAAFLYRQWESAGKPFPLADQNNTCLAFCIQLYRLIEAGQNSELIILLWGLVLFVFSLNGWCNTSPCIHPMCAYSLIVCHVAARSKITIP